MQALCIEDSASVGGPKMPPWAGYGSFYAVEVLGSLPGSGHSRHAVD